jgi:hypothetical protein
MADQKKASWRKAKPRACSSLFFEIKGIVQAGQTVNSACCFDILWLLHENVRRLRPKLWGQRTGCFIMTMHHQTLPFSPGDFLPKTK